jgi:hypothetical protein
MPFDPRMLLPKKPQFQQQNMAAPDMQSTGGDVPQTSSIQQPQSPADYSLGMASDRLQQALAPKKIGFGGKLLDALAPVFGPSYGQERETARATAGFNVADKLAQENRLEQLNQSTMGRNNAEVANFQSEIANRGNVKQDPHYFPGVDEQGNPTEMSVTPGGTAQSVGRRYETPVKETDKSSDHIVSMGPDGKPHNMGFNNTTKKYDQDMGLAYERPVSTNSSGAQESRDIKWVMWNDANGRQMAGPLSEAKKSGAANPAELGAPEVKDILNARNAVHLMTKVGDPSRPETMGTLQLIDSLDKEGKLGVFASRWNKMLTTGVGAAPGDDPRIVTLLNKNDLGQTLAMLAHFGASGGRSPAILKHFMDLADAGKMDAPTLKAGTKAIADYMADKGMSAAPEYGDTVPAKAKHTVGESITIKGKPMKITAVHSDGSFDAQ